ncbi:Ribosomal protein L11 methyltransferase [bacterium HR19]|nr:Ribosomal protein L11 methyltransferase [bacterium HR19]
MLSSPHKRETKIYIEKISYLLSAIERKVLISKKFWKIPLGRFIQKLIFLKRYSDNFEDFLMFLLSAKDNAEISIKKKEKIFFSREDRKNLFQSDNLRLYKAISGFFWLEEMGICKPKNDKIILKKDNVELEIEKDKIKGFDLFFEGLILLGDKVKFLSLKDKVILLSFEFPRDKKDEVKMRVNLETNPDALYNIYEIFFEEPYRCCDFSGLSVIDVGCGIGDSVIYFLKSGAEKVLGFDISESAIHECYENLKLNNLSAELFCREITPSDILSEKADVLKIDCEGCERELISRYPLTVKHIAFEFHFFPAKIFLNLIKKRFLPTFISFYNTSFGIAHFKKI